MKRIVVLILFLQSLLLCQSFTEVETFDKQTLYEKDIKSFGIGNLSDIFRLADKWFSSTIDRVNWQASANNLTTFQRQNYIIMLDNQRFDIGIFDNQNINLLPVSISQIDSIEFINTPQIYNGEFTERGLIHFHTKTPGNNLTVNASQYVGNETGDPGPFKYSEFITPNIDKLNFNTGAVINYGSKNWYLTGSYKNEENYATSSDIIDRITNLSDDNKIRLGSPFFKLQVTALGMINQFIAGISTQNDFFFFKPYGNEIPVKRKTGHAGLNGSFKSDKNLMINYTVSFSTNDLGERANKENINFDFQLQNYLMKLEGIYTSDFTKTILGFSLDKYDAITSSSLIDDSYTFKKLYFNSIFAISKNYSQQAGVYLNKSNNQVTVKCVLSNMLKIDSHQTIKSSFSFSSRSYYEDLNHLTWYKMNYSIPLTKKISTNIYGDLDNSHSFTADLIYIYKIDSIMSFTANGSFRKFSNLYFENENYQYNSIQSSFSSMYDIYTSGNCKVISGGIAFKFNLLPQLEQKLSYQFQKDIDGTDLLRKIWMIYPHHQFAWYINYFLNNDFGISADLRYSSSTEWNEYQYTLYQTNNLYNKDIKDRIIFNMAVQKWFWDKQIWTSLTFRNIFNQKEYYQPIGADSNLRFYFQVHVYLNMLPN